MSLVDVAATMFDLPGVGPEPYQWSCVRASCRETVRGTVGEVLPSDTGGAR